jgi:hypothetical protein
VAVEVAEPYKISSATAKTPTPRLETEISYATKIKDATLQAWGSGLYQTASRNKDVGTARPGQENHSVGGALGVEAGVAGFDLLASGYYGEGLGMISVQDGDEFGSSSTDVAGKERTQYGYLLQATYKLTPAVKLGVNYGQSRQDKSDADKAGLNTTVPMARQEGLAVMAVYNFNAFTQFVLEYSWAQNVWQDEAKQHSNSVALGTMFYW